MTDRSDELARARKPSAGPASFLTTRARSSPRSFGFLGVRMAQGQDPALGARKRTPLAVAPHKVLVRKVIVTKRITVIKPAPAPHRPPRAAGHAAPSQARRPAPSYAAPAQTSAPAPAPRPAPAPVATATS